MSQNKKTRVIEFTVSDNLYCLTIDTIGEVISPGKLSSAPNLPTAATGVMDYRNETIEVWNASILLHHEDAELVKRKQQVDKNISEQFESIEDQLRTLIESGELSDEDTVDAILNELTSLRSNIVDREAQNIDNFIDEKRLIVLNEDYLHHGRRIGWLVDSVADVRIATRENLDDSIGGAGVYGALREDTDDDEDELSEAEQTFESIEHKEFAIWIDPQAVISQSISQ